MATYDAKQVLTDYATGKITSEMAAGDSLQHIDKLYEAHTAARTEWRTTIDALKKQVNAQQTQLDRLTAFIEKVRAKRKSNATNQTKSAKG